MFPNNKKDNKINKKNKMMRKRGKKKRRKLKFKTNNKMKTKKSIQPVNFFCVIYSFNYI